MRELAKVIVHCSASEFGDVDAITAWHQARGWRTCGYHFVVLNGFATPGIFKKVLDGAVQYGRPLDEIGAHTRGHNSKSIGVCMIGKGGKFTVLQVHRTVELVAKLCFDHQLSVYNVFGHRSFNKAKSCPDFEIWSFRMMVQDRLNALRKVAML